MKLNTYFSVARVAEPGQRWRQVIECAGLKI